MVGLSIQPEYLPGSQPYLSQCLVNFLNNKLWEFQSIILGVLAPSSKGRYTGHREPLLSSQVVVLTGCVVYSLLQPSQECSLRPIVPTHNRKEWGDLLENLTQVQRLDCTNCIQISGYDPPNIARSHQLKHLSSHKVR